MVKADPQLVARVESALACHVCSTTRVEGGYTPAERWVFVCADGSCVFIKVGVSALTAAWVRDEQRFYSAVRAPFVPRYLGWDDDGERPFIALEDLRRADWPPPWDPPSIDAVLHSLEQMHALSPGPILPDFATRHGNTFSNWLQIAAAPQPFLALGLASEKWLARSLPLLIEAEKSIDTTGMALTHFDIRSDNICLREGRALLIDWNGACLGNPRLDLGFWLPSLAAEGGPVPESILSDAADVAAAVSGFFAARAGLPQVPDAPRVRWIQQVQLKTALPWVVRALELPLLDGPSLD